MRRFSPRDLHQYLDQTETPPLLLDVREEWEYDYCHIDGSMLIPMGQVPKHLEELDKEQQIKALQEDLKKMQRKVELLTH